MSSELKVPCGKRADGTIVHITELTPAENGLKCGCVCPKCEQPLQARNMGKVRVPYFAHHKETSCEGAVESALHLFAKEVFARHTSVRVPEYTTWVAYQTAVVTEALDVPYSGVQLEHSLGNVIPDIILERGPSKPPLLVEIAVTHFVDDEKREKLEALGYPCIEIDLHDMVSLSEFDREAIERVLIHDEENKGWLFHPNEEVVRAKIMDELRAADEERDRQKRRAEEARRRRDERNKQERQRVMSAEYQQTMAVKTAKELATNPIWVDNRRAFGIPQDAPPPWYLDFEINGEYLWTVHRTVWQSALFRTWVFNKQKEGRKPFVSVEFALQNLHEIYPGIWEEVLFWAWRDMKDLVRPPAEVIADYFMVLADCGFLKADDTTGNPFYWTFECIRPGIALLPQEYNSPRYMPAKGEVYDTETKMHIALEVHQPLGP